MPQERSQTLDKKPSSTDKIEMATISRNGHTQVLQADRGANHNDLKIILTVLCFIISLVYSVLLVFLLSYLKNNMFFNFIALIAVIVLFAMAYMIIVNDLYKRSEWNTELHATLQLAGICTMCLTIMCVLTFLSRIAHDRVNQEWSQEFILSALKANALVHIFGYLCKRHWGADTVWLYQGEIIRLVFNNADTFAMLEAGLEYRGERLEVIVQAFCTASFFPVLADAFLSVRSLRSDGHATRCRFALLQLVHTLCQDLPFLILRAYILDVYGNSQLEFIAKNAACLILSGIAVYKAKQLQEPIHEYAV